MKNYLYTLTDRNGKVLTRGTKKQVMRVASDRYVYKLIFDDVMTREEIQK